jgi:hypothetical protein
MMVIDSTPYPSPEISHLAAEREAGSIRGSSNVDRRMGSPQRDLPDRFGR